MELRTFERAHLDGVIRICGVEGWDSYTGDAERTFRALSSSGVVTVVAVENDEVLGFAQVLTDGAIRAYLANMVVAKDRRGSGIGRKLIEAAFDRVTAVYVDLLAADDATGFYERFRYQKLPGYRLYPATPKK